MQGSIEIHLLRFLLLKLVLIYITYRPVANTLVDAIGDWICQIGVQKASYVPGQAYAD